MASGWLLPASRSRYGSPVEWHQATLIAAFALHVSAVTAEVLPVTFKIALFRVNVTLRLSAALLIFLGTSQITPGNVAVFHPLIVSALGPLLAEPALIRADIALVTANIPVLSENRYRCGERYE
jgi:hypothetical protein